MTELIQSSSTEIHEDTLEHIFRVAVKNESRPVDAKLMSIAKQLTTQYMDHFRPIEAIEIVKLVLHRTWPRFVSAPTNEVDMTTTFPSETIELVELMSKCYSQLRQPDSVETTLTKLFNAILTPKSIDFKLLNKVQIILIDHFDKHNLPEKAIGVLQRALPARRTGLGPTHDDTIKTLYELGQRSRERARTYPYWIDFYSQIVTYLNKDADICQPRALDAIIIVATSYWDDGRYSDAVPMFKVLFNTFIQKPKEQPQFAQADFVQSVYSRYYSCLEQTGARFDNLYQVTTSYRTTCISVFGAQASITVQATLALARIAYSSESHMSEALNLYEETSRQTGSTEHKSEIQRALSTLYTRQVITQSSTSVKSETIESARIRSAQQYESSISKFGYSHQSTLSRLHEVALLYHRQNKSETAAKELIKASKEIIMKETSSMKMVEAAESIVQSFQASQTNEYCKKFILELYRQIVSKDASQASAWGFDLTKSGRSALSFVAAMECRLDTSLSFSQTMAELTVLMVYFEEYRSVVRSNSSLQVILTTASTLRAFLVKTRRHDQATALDQEIASIFVSRDGSKMKLLSNSSARILMVAIMEYLGAHKTPSSHPQAQHFIKAVLLASIERLEKLMTAEQYAEAYDIANCAFEFALENEGCSGPKGISHGFKLASTLFSKQCPDAGLRKQMRQLSSDICKKVLDECKKQNINFVQVQFRELDRLVVLLGEVQDYETLEWLLTTLWNTREAHREWSSQVLHNLGRRLICARFLAGHPIKALRLCEDITYNMRRTHGASHQTTRDMNVLLAELYTSTGNYYLQQGKDKSKVELANQYFAKAVNVHEQMLRSAVGNDVDDDEDQDSTGAILAEHGISLNVPSGMNGHDSESFDQTAAVKSHLRLLKLAYQRLGYWPRPWPEYEALINQVFRTFSLDTKEIQTPDKWTVKTYGNGKCESANEGTFEKVDTWRLLMA